jgi:Nucleotidyl transferase AbiEii toxin, Type IV TA system
MPRSRMNSRIKDLPDIALPATVGPILASTLRSAFERTFEFRGTHDLPTDLPPPPAAWEAAYQAMAMAEELASSTLEELHRAVRGFVEPVLSSRQNSGRWTPDSWSWTHRR